MGDDRHCSGAATRLVIRLVRARGGDRAVDDVLRLAGQTCKAAELEDVRSWSSFGEFRGLLEATITALGDAGALREAGAQALVSDAAVSDGAALLRSLGSPTEVLRRVPDVATRFCTVVDMETLDAGDGFGLVRAVSRPGFPRYAALCEFTAGLLGRVAPLFDLTGADVVELQCEARGDAQCLFRLSWATGGPLPVADAVGRAYAAVAGRFEALRDSVADLVSADDLETVLSRIAARAGLAVRAPRHLLAVRAPGDIETRVHHRGFTSGEAAGQAARLLAAAGGSHDPSWLVADVASARHHYGRLAAVHAAGASFFPGEGAILSAYAGLAAAALDAATALDQARRDASAANTLVALAGELASAPSVAEVARRVAAAAPKLADADAAGVWLWNAADESLSLAAHVGFSPDAERALSSARIGPVDSKSLQAMIDHPAPRLATARSTDDPIVEQLLETSGHRAALVVPIVLDGVFSGALAAGVVAGPERLSAQPDTEGRLSGLAQFGAIALRNARALDEIRHDAYHDPLTGLPNQRLLADRFDRAAAHGARTGERFAVLYLDLDRFKAVNDTHGHSVGDQILCQVGRRLDDAMRAEDTVARLGGDEFVVLVPRAERPEEVAVVVEKIRWAFAEPFWVDRARFELTVSIGVAIFPLHGSEAEELLGAADEAMYVAKRQGRDRVSWSAR